MAELRGSQALRVNLLELHMPKPKAQRKPCGPEMVTLLTCVQGDANDHVQCAEPLKKLEDCMAAARLSAPKSKHKPTENFHLLRIARQAGVVARKSKKLG
jgi:hypothetical protein